jgi:hypothetical protein
MGHGVGDAIVPLKLIRDVCHTPEEVERNIEQTLRRGYFRFNGLMDSQSGPVSIVGAGPSLARHYGSLVGDVIACNTAHDYLIKRGVVPRFAMIFDAHPVMADCVTPHPDVVYLIASRCHEAVFEKLKDNKVVVWHCKGDHCIDALLEKHELMEPMIHGGSAAVLRALFIARAMGWRDAHLFGVDSSYEESDSHIEGRELVPERALEIWAGRWFKSTAWMAGQVEDFRDMAPMLRDQEGMQITVHGEGLLPCVAKAMGFPVVSIEQDDPQQDEQDDAIPPNHLETTHA